MATTSVIAISLISEAGRTKTLNIDNPKENLNLNEIKNALQPSLNKKFWKDTYGDFYSSVSKAELQTVQKIQLAEGEVTISPSSITETLPTAQRTYTITVTNGNVSMASFKAISQEFTGDARPYFQIPEITNTTDGATIFLILKSNSYVYGINDYWNLNLELLIYGEIITIPFKYTKE